MIFSAKSATPAFAGASFFGIMRWKAGTARPASMGRPMALTTHAAACVICGKPQVERFRPFCSRRCADVDLYRWLSGVYAIPVAEDEDEDRNSRPSGEE
jgi:uncharacterized protein